MNLRPLNDRVIVRRSAEEEKTAGGIIIPGNAKEKPLQGEVLAVGLGRLLDNGQRVAMDVSIGSTVVFGKYAGTEIKVGDEMLLILNEADILAVVE